MPLWWPSTTSSSLASGHEMGAVTSMRALTKGESAAPIMSWYWPVITLRGAKNREWRRVEEVVAVKAELQEEVAVEARWRCRRWRCRRRMDRGGWAGQEEDGRAGRRGSAARLQRLEQRLQRRLQLRVAPRRLARRRLRAQPLPVRTCERRHLGGQLIGSLPCTARLLLELVQHLR